MENDSPFDKALSRPLSGEPATKRWVSPWLSLSSSKDSSNSSSNNNDISDHTGFPKSVDIRAPLIEIQCRTTQQKDIQDKETTLLLLKMEEGSMVRAQDLDTAIARERFEGIQHIHSSMLTLNQIQKDLALVVECQSEKINELQDNGVNSALHTVTGMHNLDALHQHAMTRNRRRRERLLALSGLLVACVSAAHWFSQDAWSAD